MYDTYLITHIAKDLALKEGNVKATVELLEAASTIPFIARYRKEKTGSLDETQIRHIHDKLSYYKTLAERKKTILKSIESQNKLTSEIEKKIEQCRHKEELEDLYLPFKVKKKSKAFLAQEKGLEPLAYSIWKQELLSSDQKEKLLSSYINPKIDLNTQDDALQGALHIVAEWISENADLRQWIRRYIFQKGSLFSKVKKEWVGQKSKFETYYDFSEPIKTAPAHRILAMKRGYEEKVLTWGIKIDEESIFEYMKSSLLIKQRSCFENDLIDTLHDAYKRLMKPSLENEVLNIKLEEADTESIKVFSSNLRSILLTPPAGNKVIVGIDPGFRTGCKIAIIDKNGNFMHHTTIYPNEPHNKQQESTEIMLKLFDAYPIDIIAVGNGTASRETISFIQKTLKRSNKQIAYLTISEAGASVYSASELAAKEFPLLDVTVRGAISIARRLQDPLSELIKIDPKSIGVGQYQHDVNQTQLKKSLESIVESVVNYVGVDLNTASEELLTYVSGIGTTLAKNIVHYRSEHSLFTSREELKKVPKVGPKVYEQCAGFLRIKNPVNPLDNSSIHPEAYPLVTTMAKDLHIDLQSLIGHIEFVLKIDPLKYISAEIGLPTLTDILEELKKPGLDPRKEFTNMEFNTAIRDMKDLEQGMILKGIVTNITNFGAFVDIGVHQDGLIHISKLSKGFVRNPHEVITVGEQLTVKVIDMDLQLKRISLEKVFSAEDSLT